MDTGREKTCEGNTFFRTETDRGSCARGRPVGPPSAALELARRWDMALPQRGSSLGGLPDVRYMAKAEAARGGRVSSRSGDDAAALPG